MDDLKVWIRSVPDFPIPGILFYDITTLLKRPEGLAAVIEALIEQYRDEQVDIVAGIESRGFMFGTPLALELNAGFVPIRKPGKLPAETIHREYELEYGNNRLEIHRDAIQPGQRVLVIDDLLATGGTAKASIELIEELGGTVVGAAFVVELAFLNGRETLKGCEVFSLLTYYE
jgi:adenine phosphoribosyltransferase